MQDLFRDEPFDIMSGTCDGDSRRVTAREEQHITRMPEAEAEKNRMKQMILEQQVPTGSMRMKLGAEMKQARDIAVTAPEDSHDLRSSIAKHKSVYSSACETLIADREVRSSSSTGATEVVAVRGKVEGLRAELQDTSADNEDIMQNVPEIGSKLQASQGRACIM